MSSKYRIRVVPDEYFELDWDFADDEHKAEAQRILERDGAWGYVVERWGDSTAPCPVCRHAELGHWEDVDSCFGFLGNDTEYMMSQATDNIPAGLEVPVVDERGREINTATGTKGEKHE